MTLAAVGHRHWVLLSCQGERAALKDNSDNSVCLQGPGPGSQGVHRRVFIFRML